MAGILFKDISVQNEFEKNGFVKIPLLNQSEVDDLKNYYLSLNNDHARADGFHISLENKSSEHIKGVFKKLFAVILPRLEPFLDNCRTFSASYLVKEAGIKSIMHPHQDWTFVDEEKYCSATVWIPLIDVNKNNGTLGLIKGSHHFFNNPRPSPTPHAKSFLADYIYTMLPYVQLVDINAGEALIFNNATIHASIPNLSDGPRIAAGIGITQKEAPLLHFYQLPGEEEIIEVYEVDESFFPEYTNGRMTEFYTHGQKPEGLKVIRSFKKSKKEYTKEMIQKLICAVDGNTVNVKLVDQLNELYGYNLEGGTTSCVKVQEEPVVQNKRSFFKTYTPSNILAEVRYRLKKKTH